MAQGGKSAMIFNKEIGELVTGPEHFEEMRRCCVAELGDLRWMQRLRAEELGEVTMPKNLSYFEDFDIPWYKPYSSI